jgi:hypothetical protein
MLPIESDVDLAFNRFKTDLSEGTAIFRSKEEKVPEEKIYDYWISYDSKRIQDLSNIKDNPSEISSNVSGVFESIQQLPDPVVLTLDGCVEKIQGELALVVFNTPNGYLERYVSLERLQAKKASFLGARIRIISKQRGSQTITDIENVSSEIPPVWNYEDKELEEFFATVKSE